VNGVGVFIKKSKKNTHPSDFGPLRGGNGGLVGWWAGGVVVVVGRLSLLVCQGKAERFLWAQIDDAVLVLLSFSFALVRQEFALGL